VPPAGLTQLELYTPPFDFVPLCSSDILFFYRFIASNRNEQIRILQLGQNCGHILASSNGIYLVCIYESIYNLGNGCRAVTAVPDETCSPVELMQPSFFTVQYNRFSLDRSVGEI
jgi:hypothetical protein